MKTYQDLLEAGESEEKRMQFIASAISAHQASKDYQTAMESNMYFRGKNPTIEAFKKVLHNLKGQAVPDLWHANHKSKNHMYPRFMIQRVAYLLENGVTFEKDETYKKLGDDFQDDLYRNVKIALSEKMVFGFYNLDHIDFFRYTEFVPLWDEVSGALMAGIRFWQIAANKPLRATLYEVDGYTEYLKKDSAEMQVKQEKRAYKYKVRSSAADGQEIYDFENYPSFPIVPLWANDEHQSALVGHQEDIDCYDLIKSGFANDMDDATMIYWILKNTGGMKDDVTLAKFVERMHIIKAAVVKGENVEVEPKTVDVPYESREAYLSRLEKDLIRDFMAVDTEKIAAGNVTATQIKASYAPLKEVCKDLRANISLFLKGIFLVAGIDDTITFNPAPISNSAEEDQMILAAATVLDDETILEKLSFVRDDEINKILERKAKEQMDRFPLVSQKQQQEPPEGGEVDETGD